MKKIIIVSALAVFALASCKKDYTCECTSTVGSETTTTSTTLNGKKKDVEAACTAGNSTLALSNAKCEIK